MKIKICIVSGTRAEYGLLYWLMKEIEADSELDLQLIATGMHLSPEFGLTYKQIEKDGFLIDKKIEILLSSDWARCDDLRWVLPGYHENLPSACILHKAPPLPVYVLLFRVLYHA